MENKACKDIGVVTMAGNKIDDEKGAMSCNPFRSLVGIKITYGHNGQAKSELKLRDELLNGLGIGHGGVTMTMLDTMMARAVTSLWDGQDSNTNIVTAKMDTRFLKPARLGMLYGEAVVIEKKETWITVMGTIRDESGDVIAKAEAVFRIFKDE